ncbi:MAG TPA: hypothetical protein VIL37_15605 [Natronosporangium sp.]
MDEQRHTDDEIAHAETSAWRVNGNRAPARSADHSWSSAGAALEPSPEPLALLTAAQAGEGEARHRRGYTPGPDDDTPAGGVPVVEPPLWREAVRYAKPPTNQPYQPAEPAADATRPPDPPPPPPPPPALTPPTQPPTPEPPRSSAAQPAQPSQPAERAGDQRGLPQRVPAEPDVPVSRDPDTGAGSAESGTGRDRWTAPELAWIADQLRRSDVPSERPPESLDVAAVVAAVEAVPGVRSASVRPNPTGVHTLRLDLHDDADPGQVSRTVARLLLEKMGLSASPQHVPQARTSQESEAATAATTEEVRPLEPLRTAPTPAPAPAPEQPPAEQWTPPAPRPGWRAEPESGAEVDQADQYDELTDPVEEQQPEPVSRPLPTRGQAAPRVVINQVFVSTSGLEATVEVRLSAGGRQATGVASGPAVDSYLVRLAAVAAAKAIDELLRAVVEPGGPSRCFVEHTGVVSFGKTEVAVAVVLLVCGGWVEQLTGSALVDGDPRQAVVRATLGAVNRRLEALLD